MQAYFAKIAVPDGTAKQLAAFNKLAEKAQREKVMQRLTEAEGVRRPFGRSKGRGREDNGMTQAQLYEVQQRLFSGAAESQPMQFQQSDQPMFELAQPTMVGFEQNPIERSRIQIDETDFMMSDREDNISFAFEESKTPHPLVEMKSQL